MKHHSIASQKPYFWYYKKTMSQHEATHLFKSRHSLAHVLLMAIKKHYPKALPTIGPVTETGFYYDIDFGGTKVGPEDLEKLEKAMKEILNQKLDFVYETITTDKAKELFKDNTYKLEIIDGIKNTNAPITVYHTGKDFFDLCEGPHITNTKEIPVDSFKLSTVAGAYWRGDEKNPMLTRIYGLAFESKEALDTYILQQEEAKKRDHRILGKQLKLFIFSDLVGPGLPLWTPRGTILRKEIDSFVQQLRKEYNYGQVTIPHFTKPDLYIKSQHYEKYGDDLFKVKTRDGHELCIKPMNCPHHAQIYASELRSYKELPIRYSETTMVYRDEQSGELNGLSRVLSITQDDAHVFCRESQLKEEMNNIWNLIESFYKAFGFNDLVPRFSRRNDDAKFKGNIELWEKAEGAIKSLLEQRASGKWVDGEGEAAFYGPKIDFMAKDAIGRSHQVGTIQLDFVQPTNFELEYVNEEGKRDMPVMIHCAIAGSLERFLSVYIEHTAGNFPLWMSPTQISIIPIRDTHNEYAKTIFTTLEDTGIRVELDDSKDGLGKKVRTNKEMKTPYWAVIGDAEVANGTVTLEHRTEGKIGEMKVEDLIAKLTTEIKEKK
jgi:threonyl-tRNA synthetase